MKPLIVSAFTATSAVGLGNGALLDALHGEKTGLKPDRFETSTIQTWLGCIPAELAPLPEPFRSWDCRNNRLAELSLRQDDFEACVERAKIRYGASRIGVFLGTSTSGVHNAEIAYRERDRNSGRLPDWFDLSHTQNNYSVVSYIKGRLGLTGASLAISTACSSSAKIFATAYRMIQSGFCDAAIVGGVDSLCLTTIYGFSALQLTSQDICRPADKTRSGLSIGEAGGFALLERDYSDSDLYLAGYGESSDAYHMSAPDPTGRGASAAMHTALSRAELTPAQIDYINLHGTATPANDRAEDEAVVTLFGENMPCSSTKGWTGHTLGAAGIVEAVISLLCLRSSFVPLSLNTRLIDPALRANYLLESQQRKLTFVASNSFGFGGNNCCLVFGKRT